jgi:WD40 repeat protein
VNNQKENMQLLLSGGSDNIVNISNPEAMTIIKSITFESIPRSLDYGKKLLVGLRDGTILEYDVQTNVMLEIMVSHHDGEAWGLCTVKGTPNFYSSGDDNKILYYDIENRMC